MESIGDSKDFTIENLQRIILEKDKEIERLEKLLADVRYWGIASLDHIKLQCDKNKEVIQRAVDGYLEKPTLRSL